MLSNENIYLINIICNKYRQYINSFEFSTKFKFLIKYLRDFLLILEKKVPLCKASRVE